jgi:hypothetical protein
MHPPIKAVAFLGIVFFTMLFNLQTGFAQTEPVSPESRQVDYAYGEYLTLVTKFSDSLKIESVQLNFAHGQISNTRVFEVALGNNNQTLFQYDANEYGAIPAYSPVRYSYILNLTDGESLTTETFTFAYLDNRFEWQTLDQDERFVIHWYEGGQDFAQSILNAAVNSISVSDQFIRLPDPSRLHIFVYSSATDLRLAMNPTGTGTAAGHANPSFGVALVSIQPGVEQNLQIERQIPHEINHIRLYQETGDGYTKLPVWLREGLASLVELYPNPDYTAALEIASEEGSLIPLSSLCDSFPIDARESFLAYAESQSFVNYLFDIYGTVGINKFVLDYSQGSPCDTGLQTSTGKSLHELELGWQTSEFGRNAQPSSSQPETTAWIWVLFLITLLPTSFIFIIRKIA